MTKSQNFANVRRDLLTKYEQGATIDIADWIARFPEMREDLLGYWMLLRATPRLESAMESVAIRDHGIAQRALRRAVEAISLGPGWLRDAIEPQAEELERIGERLAAVRRSRRISSGKAGPAFRRAAVYAWVAVTIGKQRGPTTRLAVQKVTHLLERGLDLGLFDRHKQMLLGPYDSTARYKDAEPIATKHEWLEVSGTQLRPGANSNAVSTYAQRYVRDVGAARALVEHLAKLNDAELETWATVEWVAQDLAAERKAFDPASIRARLAVTSKWSAKLRKSNFSEEELTRAAEALARLGMIDSIPRSQD